MQESHRSEGVDIELQKQPASPTHNPGDHGEDATPLLGDSGGDAGAGDMVAMPVAAWLLLVAAVSRRPAVYRPSDTFLCARKQFRLTLLRAPEYQLCAKSSAGAVFEALHDVGPFTAAAWRMQVATLGMLPFAAFQYWRCGAGDQVIPV